MRILSLLATEHYSGPSEICLTDAQALRAAGHEVIFGCDTKRSPRDFVSAIQSAGFELMEELTFCRKPTPLDIPRDVARLRRRMRGTDLVHCRFSHDHTVALLAMQGLGRRPLLVRSAEIAPSICPGLARGIAFRACDAVVVACAEYAEQLRSVHRVASDRIHVLPGRVDVERFSPGDASPLRHELGIGEGELLFGIVSRIKADRRHDLLVDAFAQVSKAEPRAKLAIVGRGEHEPTIREQVVRLGLQERVLFAGYRQDEELVRAYRAFDVKIWLVEGNDGTCRAVLEAMACGKPVVVGDSGAMAEAVRNGVEGAVVPLEQQALTRALLTFGNDAYRTAAGARALERSRDFVPSVRAGKLLALYDRLLASR